jgi:hypothetical protein
MKQEFGDDGNDGNGTAHVAIPRKTKQKHRTLFKNKKHIICDDGVDLDFDHKPFK